MKLLLLLALLATSLFSYDLQKAEKSLLSLDRAEVYASRLVQRNELDDATRFIKEARKKYKNSFQLLYWNGELYLEEGKLDLAEKCFRQALVLKKNNKLAKQKIEYIQEQKEAKENSDVADLLAVVNDKGLDFLMIFLAFLGSELIAKRYNTCQNNSIYTIGQNYLRRKQLEAYRKESFFKRLFSQIKKTFSKTFSNNKKSFST
jgi:tetratricopeptide (TPR) repeat protein